MADLVRVYRRWALARLVALAPPSLAAGALALWQGLKLQAGSATQWIDLTCLGAAVVLFAFVGALTLRTLLCYGRFRAGRIEAARQVRRELEPAGPVAFVVFSLVVFVAVLPACFPPPEPLPDLPVPAVSLLPRLSVPEPIARVAHPGGTDRSTPPPSRPEPRRANEGLTLAVPLAIEPGEARFFQEQDDPVTPWRLEPTQRFDRLGVPDPTKPLQWLDPELNVEVMLVTPSGKLDNGNEKDLDVRGDLEMRGAGVRLTYDLPTDRDESLRFHYQMFGLAATNDVVDIAESSLDELLVWQRFGATYHWRLLGYTTDATLDFSFFAGVMADNLLTDAQGGVASEVLRISPYLGCEIGFWQHGPVGAVFRVGQTLPTNLTGATALVTDVSAVLRVDLSNGLSVHFGYSGYWAHFRDHQKKLTDVDGHENAVLMLHGPVLGLDLRF